MDNNSKIVRQKRCRNIILISSWVLIAFSFCRSLLSYIDNGTNLIADIIGNRLNITLIVLGFFGTTISINQRLFSFFFDYFLEVCWKWVETNIITVLFTFAFVFVFLYFEKEIVEASFSFLSKIKGSKFGIVLLWVLAGILLATMIYGIINKFIHNTLSDGRAFFLSLILSGLFAYCWKKYPWKGMIDAEIGNPIAGHEWACIVLFVMFALCFLVTPFILYIIVKTKINRYKRDSLSKQQGSYLSDIPITSKDEDELHFDNHVLALKKKIEEIPNTGSHSIALTGGWGTGKTSFLNLLELELKESVQYEIMWFNPMKSSKSGNIQNDFFDTLENTLSKYKTGFGRRIKYYKELIGAIDNKYVAFLVKLGSIQLEQEKQRINDIINMIPKKIIIIIDDLDRLKGDEIMQVLRIVGLNADFNNVVFLTAFDKRNVIKALGCDFNYPDKFFESEFPLPDNNRKTTSLFVQNTLSRLLPDYNMGFLKDQIIIKYTNYCLSNLRDAIRFINGFLDRVTMIYNKLDVCSFYLLYLIRYKSPSLHEQIKNQEFLGNKELEGNQYLVLKEDFSIEDSILNSIVHHLFPQDTTSDSGHYIYQPEFFDDYFNDTSTKSISDAMMVKILLSNNDKELQQTLNQHVYDDISKQNLTDLWQNNNTWSVVKSLYIKNDQTYIITNYYRVFDYLKIDNGLSYHEGLAFKKLNQDEYACIDSHGFVSFMVYANLVEHFSESFALVSDNGECGFIDKEGKIAIPFNYKYAGSFSDGLARVYKDGKWGFIDKAGKVAIPLIYDYIGRFSEGLARVYKDGRCGAIDKEGKAAIPLEYDDVGGLSEGLAIVGKSGKCGAIDKEGRIAIPLEYDYIGRFSEGLAVVEKSGKYGFIDKEGRIAIPLEYDYIGGFSDGLAVVIKSGKYWFINKEGKAAIPFNYKYAGSFSEGLARVKQNGKWGFIDKEGKAAIPLEYDDAGGFSEGLAVVGKSGKYGFIDKEGRIAIPLEYDYIGGFSEGLAIIRKSGKYGFIDKEGNVAIPLEYNDAVGFFEGLAVVIKSGKWGFIDKAGTFLPSNSIHMGWDRINHIYND